MKTLDRLEFIRLFVRIAESGSLWSATQSVGVSQPAVSSGKVSLFGVNLVRRSTYDLALTDAGSRFT
jgi:DNA-binding transcriptional LysR family regulator